MCYLHIFKNNMTFWKRQNYRDSVCSQLTSLGTMPSLLELCGLGQTKVHISAQCLLSVCPGSETQRLSQPERKALSILLRVGLPGGSDSEESACSSGGLSLILGLGRFLGEGNGNPPQYSCLGNSTDRGAWRSRVHGVTKSWRPLSD